MRNKKGFTPLENGGNSVKNAKRNTHFLTGFTLIELLIVVAIIAILAAIAIPNFLAAQVRSKVARAKADIRTVATALESYKVDSASYPLMMLMDTGNGAGKDPWLSGMSNNIPGVGTASGVNDQLISLSVSITTPVAYITREPEDPFHMYGDAAIYGHAAKRYFYSSAETYYLASGVASPDWHRLIFGEWRLASGGPVGDRAAIRLRADPYISCMTYDPTNGTISNGVILRCTRSPNGERPFYPGSVQ